MKLSIFAIICFGLAAGVFHSNAYADVKAPAKITLDQVDDLKRPALEKMTKKMLIDEAIFIEWKNQNAQESELFHKRLFNEAIKQNIELEKRIKELEEQ